MRVEVGFCLLSVYLASQIRGTIGFFCGKLNRVEVAEGPALRFFNTFAIQYLSSNKTPNEREYSTETAVSRHSHFVHQRHLKRPKIAHAIRSFCLPICLLDLSGRRGPP
jgi:hypothetical protein